MPERYGEDDEAELDGREAPDESDMDADESAVASDTEPCPFCRKPVYPDADICPHCRNFIAIPQLPQRRSWWFYVALVLSLLIVLMWALFG